MSRALGHVVWLVAFALMSCYPGAKGPGPSDKPGDAGAHGWWTGSWKGATSDETWFEHGEALWGVNIADATYEVMLVEPTGPGGKLVMTLMRGETATTLPVREETGTSAVFAGTDIVIRYSRTGDTLTERVEEAGHELRQQEFTKLPPTPPPSTASETTYLRVSDGNLQMSTNPDDKVGWHFAQMFEPDGAVWQLGRRLTGPEGLAQAFNYINREPGHMLHGITMEHQRGSLGVTLGHSILMRGETQANDDPTGSYVAVWRQHSERDYKVLLLAWRSDPAPVPR